MKKSALSLLVLGILTNHHDTAFSFNDFALLANLFHGRFNFHLDTPFLSLFFSPGDTALGRIVNRDLNGHGVSRENTDIVHTKLSGDMRVHDMSVRKLYLEVGVGECLDYHAVLKYDQIVLRQKNPSILIRLIRRRRSDKPFRHRGSPRYARSEQRVIRRRSRPSIRRQAP